MKNTIAHAVFVTVNAIADAIADWPASTWHERDKAIDRYADDPNRLDFENDVLIKLYAR